LLILFLISLLKRRSCAKRNSKKALKNKRSPPPLNKENIEQELLDKLILRALFSLSLFQIPRPKNTHPNNFNINNFQAKSLLNCQTTLTLILKHFFNFNSIVAFKF